MREKERINRILSKIEQVMLKENKFFMGVLRTCFNDNSVDDPFFIEDSTIEMKLDSRYSYVQDSKELESEFMNQIYTNWKKKPDLRLFQIICNGIERNNESIEVEYKKDPWYISDKEIFKIFKN